MVQITAEVSSQTIVLRRQKNIVVTGLREGKTCHPEIYNQEKYHSRMKVKEQHFKINKICIGYMQTCMRRNAKGNSGSRKRILDKTCRFRKE